MLVSQRTKATTILRNELFIKKLVEDRGVALVRWKHFVDLGIDVDWETSSPLDSHKKVAVDLRRHSILCSPGKICLALLHLHHIITSTIGSLLESTP